VAVPPSFPILHDDAHARRAYDRSGGALWEVSLERFREALAQSLAHRYPEGPPPDGGRAYIESLDAPDLALACACLDGHDGAWQHVILELRPQLYHAARTIAGDAGRELADSLYADLFGLPGADGTRRSLLAHYHGRSRLLTWLRSVLVQRHIDVLRTTRRLDQLDEDGGDRLPASAPGDLDPDRGPLVAHAQGALDEAIDALDDKDRLRLRLYYGQDLTLAAIGRLLGEHEATVSRKLEKARKRLRASVERSLASRGLAPAAVARAFELAADAPDLQLDRLLARADDG
jgi:RNA polymerase sigma-70 factor, ECF subfamily